MNSYDVRQDWARNDQRHRFFGSFSGKSHWLGAYSFLVTLNSGRAYSITTGMDENFDGSFNDRPNKGVKRNSLRGPSVYTVNLIYSTPTIPYVPLRFNIQVTNLLNNTQINGYGSVITSPFFGMPTSYGAGRSIRLSTSIVSF